MTAASPRPVWMLVLFAVAAVIGLFNIGAYLYGLTLPDEWAVKESIEISASADEIYPSIATPRRWSKWTSWNPQQDPSLLFEYTGPASGQDAAFSWSGEQLGRGSLTILDASENRSVHYRLELQGETFSEQGQITLEPLEGGTRVTWTDGGELGSTLGRLFRERLVSSVSADFAASLGRLKEQVESTPSESDATPTDEADPSRIEPE